MMIKYFKIFVLIILIQSSAFASSKDDCRSSSFYIKNVKVDFTKKSIVEARSLAEQKARLIALNRLLHRLTLKNKNLTFENSKVDPNTSISLFGIFLENFISKLSINTDDLYFYFKFDDDNASKNKLLNILDNIDYLENSTLIIQGHATYLFKKNNVEFVIKIYPNFVFDVQFNIQNIEFDSINGLQNKYITLLDSKRRIQNNSVSLIDIMKNIYLSEATYCVDVVNQVDSTDLVNNIVLNNLITTQERFIENGFKINKGIKIVNLSEKCAICYETNKKGLMLICRHSFCIECIKKYLISTHQEQGNEKKCPLCRSQLNVVFD